MTIGTEEKKSQGALTSSCDVLLHELLDDANKVRLCAVIGTALFSRSSEIVVLCGTEATRFCRLIERMAVKNGFNVVFLVPDMTYEDYQLIVQRAHAKPTICIGANIQTLPVCGLFSWIDDGGASKSSFWNMPTFLTMQTVDFIDVPFHKYIQFQHITSRTRFDELVQDVLLQQDLEKACQSAYANFSSERFSPEA